ncbi:MAG: hypothetical protein Q9226_005689 [Calogaya cf. arnoldii]
MVIGWNDQLRTLKSTEVGPRRFLAKIVTREILFGLHFILPKLFLDYNHYDKCSTSSKSSRLRSQPENRPHTADTCSFRLVSKISKELSDEHFSITSFTALRTDLTPRSLQRLNGIAGIAAHAHNVKYLLLDRGSHDRLGEGFAWERNSTGQVINRLAGAESLQHLLVNKFINCRSFMFIYDESKMMQEYQGPLIEQYPGLNISDSISLLVSIITEAGLKVKSWAISRQGNAKSLKSVEEIWTTTFPLELCRQPQFKVAWADIRKLVLDVEITPVQHDWVLGLISEAPNLQYLSLNFYTDSADFLDRLTSALSAPPLRKLRLQGALLTGENILDLLNCFQDTLVVLCLRHVSSGPEDPWASVLAILAQKPLRLEKLSLYFLT